MPEPITPEQLYEAHRWIRLDELAALAGNPNLGDEVSLTASLAEFGWMEGITVWSGRIIAGHHRVEAARAQGLEGLPGYDLTPYAASWDDAVALAAAMTLNLTARAGGDDPALLAKALDVVGDVDSPALPPALAVTPDLEAIPVGRTVGDKRNNFVGSDTRQLVLAYGLQEHAELQLIAAEVAPGVPFATLVAQLLEVQ